MLNVSGKGRAIEYFVAESPFQKKIGVSVLEVMLG